MEKHERIPGEPIEPEGQDRLAEEAHAGWFSRNKWRLLGAGIELANILWRLKTGSYAGGPLFKKLIRVAIGVGGGLVAAIPERRREKRRAMEQKSAEASQVPDEEMNLFKVLGIEASSEAEGYEKLMELLKDGKAPVAFKAGMSEEEALSDRETEGETFEIAADDRTPVQKAIEILQDGFREKATLKEHVAPGKIIALLVTKAATLEEKKAIYEVLRRNAVWQGPTVIAGPEFVPFDNAESGIRGKIGSLRLLEELARVKAITNPREQEEELRKLSERTLLRTGRRPGDANTVYQPTKDELKRMLELAPRKPLGGPLPSERKEGLSGYLEQLARDCLRGWKGEITDQEIKRSSDGTLGHYLKPFLGNPDERDKMIYFLTHMLKPELAKHLASHPELTALKRLHEELSKRSLSDDQMLEYVGPVHTLLAENVIETHVPEAARTVANYRRGVANMEAGREAGIEDFNELKLPQAQAKLAAAEAELDDEVIRIMRGMYRQQKQEVLNAKLRAEGEDKELKLMGRHHTQLIIPVAIGENMPSVVEAAKIPDPAEVTVRTYKSRPKAAKVSAAERKRNQEKIRNLQKDQREAEAKLGDLKRQRKIEEDMLTSGGKLRPLPPAREAEIRRRIKAFDDQITAVERKIENFKKDVEKRQGGKSVTERYFEEKKVAVEEVEVGVSELVPNK